MSINSTIVKSFVFDLLNNGAVVKTVTIRARTLKKARIACKKDYQGLGYTFKFKSVS